MKIYAVSPPCLAIGFVQLLTLFTFCYEYGVCGM